MDYCLVPYEKLSYFSNFNVSTARDQVTNAGLVGRCDLSSIVPDHSLISWNLDAKNFFSSTSSRMVRKVPILKFKFDTRHIPNDWSMNDNTVANINSLIARFTNETMNQERVDTAYDQLVEIVKKKDVR